MGKDKDRPNHLKSHAPTSKVKAACNACINGYHDECLGRAANFRVKCLCDWYGHK